MTKFNTIPKGYKLTVTTWENDGDNYKTEFLYGLSKEEVLFYVELCKTFDRNTHYELSNNYDLDDDQLKQYNQLIANLCEKHAATIEQYDIDVEDDLYNLSISSGEWMVRVVEEFSVEFIPDDILIEDVTNQFI